VTTTGQKQYNPILKCKKTYLVVANNKSFSVSCIPLPIHKHLESSVGKAVKGWDRLDNGKFRNCVDDRWSLVLCILSRPMLPIMLDGEDFPPSSITNTSGNRFLQCQNIVVGKFRTQHYVLGLVWTGLNVRRSRFGKNCNCCNESLFEKLIIWRHVIPNIM